MNDMIVKTVENFFLSVLFGFIRSLLIIKDTVDPPVGDHSKVSSLAGQSLRVVVANESKILTQ